MSESPRSTSAGDIEGILFPLNIVSVVRTSAIQALYKRGKSKAGCFTSEGTELFIGGEHKGRKGRPKTGGKDEKRRRIA